MPPFFSRNVYGFYRRNAFEIDINKTFRELMMKFMIYLLFCNKIEVVKICQKKSIL